MAISQVRAQINGTWHTLTYDSASGAYKATVTAPGATSYNQSGGYYNVTVEATNDAGTTATADGSTISGLQLVVKERVAPVITILSPSSGAYVSNSKQPVVFTVVDEDGGVVFQHAWLRLCRRIVRDYKFRGSGADFTLKMWPNVRRGEKLYISPYKENADLMFDSSLACEFSVLKPYVVPLLKDLPAGKYPEADSILKAYERIEPLDEKYVPADSLIREFIGGSTFSY